MSPYTKGQHVVALLPTYAKDAIFLSEKGGMATVELLYPKVKKTLPLSFIRLPPEKKYYHPSELK